MDEAFRCRYRLFCSVDLVGSTAYKQLLKTSPKGFGADETSVPRAGDWFNHILNFYQDFGNYLKAEIDDYGPGGPDTTRPALPAAEFWKANGDELLFTFEITDAWQAVRILIVWKKAVLRYREYLKRSSPLDVKATAWTAGFPLMNTEVVFEEALGAGGPSNETALSRQATLRRRWYNGKNGKRGLTLDFIGPSIDTGFRLSQFSQANQMVISIDLAYFIGRHTDTQVKEELKMYHGGSQPLKGVLGGRPYPLFWIFVGNDAAVKLQGYLDKLGGPVHPVDPSQAADFAEHFFEEHSSYLIRPFVPKLDGSLAWGVLPPEYETAIEQMRRTAGIDEKVVKGMEKAAAAAGPGETPAAIDVTELIAKAVVAPASDHQSPPQEGQDTGAAGNERQAEKAVLPSGDQG